MYVQSYVQLNEHRAEGSFIVDYMHLIKAKYYLQMRLH